MPPTALGLGEPVHVEDGYRKGGYTSGKSTTSPNISYSRSPSQSHPSSQGRIKVNAVVTQLSNGNAQASTSGQHVSTPPPSGSGQVPSPGQSQSQSAVQALQNSFSNKPAGSNKGQRWLLSMSGNWKEDGNHSDAPSERAPHHQQQHHSQHNHQYSHHAQASYPHAAHPGESGHGHGVRDRGLARVLGNSHTSTYEDADSGHEDPYPPDLESLTSSEPDVPHAHSSSSARPDPVDNPTQDPNYTQPPASDRNDRKRRWTPRSVRAERFRQRLGPQFDMALEGFSTPSASGSQKKRVKLDGWSNEGRRDVDELEDERSDRVAEKDERRVGAAVQEVLKASGGVPGSTSRTHGVGEALRISTGKRRVNGAYASAPPTAGTEGARLGYRPVHYPYPHDYPHMYPIVQPASMAYSPPPPAPVSPGSAPSAMSASSYRSSMQPGHGHSPQYYIWIPYPYDPAQHGRYFSHSAPPSAYPHAVPVPAVQTHPSHPSHPSHATHRTHHAPQPYVHYPPHPQAQTPWSRPSTHLPPIPNQYVGYPVPTVARHALPKAPALQHRPVPTRPGKPGTPVKDAYHKEGIVTIAHPGMAHPQPPRPQ